MKDELKHTRIIKLYLQKRKKEPDRYFRHIRI
jgi:hypothetical protein